jgi:ABC-type uncharacterized transport system substrate-binding protein
MAVASGVRTHGRPMKLTRFTALALLALALLAAPLATQAQPVGKMYRIGYLGNLPITAQTAHLWEAFLEALRELGYTEGKNVLIERRYSDGQAERLPALAAELLRLRVDVLVVGDVPAAHAAKAATSTTPIVFLAVANPVEAGLVASLGRPGSNITGFAASSPGTSAKTLQLLKETVGSLLVVAIFWNPTNPFHKVELSELESAAPSLAVRLRPVVLQRQDDLVGAFRAATEAQAGAVYIIGDAWHFQSLKQLSDLALTHRLPAAHSLREFAATGGLMAFGSPDRVPTAGGRLRPVAPGYHDAKPADVFRRVAVYVDKILKGTKPADLPVEQPTKFDLVINLKTAKALGLKIPRAVLARADEVIQ